MVFHYQPDTIKDLEERKILVNQAFYQYDSFHANPFSKQKHLLSDIIHKFESLTNRVLKKQGLDPVQAVETEDSVKNMMKLLQDEMYKVCDVIEEIEANVGSLGSEVT